MPRDMPIQWSSIPLLSLLLGLPNPALSQAQSACPFLGQIYPPPQNVVKHPRWKNVSAALDTAFSTPPLWQNVTSFAVQVIFKDSKEPAYEYYNKAVNHIYGPNGDKKLDSSAMFRIGSVSKLFTVYALLLQCGFRCFENPITQYLPELHKATDRDEIESVKWDEVTIGSLASHLSGIGRDCESSILFKVSRSGVFLCFMSIFFVLLKQSESGDTILCSETVVELGNWTSMMKIWRGSLGTVFSAMDPDKKEGSYIQRLIYTYFCSTVSLTVNVN
jgi:hypothetical protein